MYRRTVSTNNLDQVLDRAIMSHRHVRSINRMLHPYSASVLLIHPENVRNKHEGDMQNRDHTARAGRWQLTSAMLSSVNVTTYLVALGLKQFSKTSNPRALAVEAMRFCESFRKLVHKITLPTNRVKARLTLLDPKTLEQDVETLFADYCYIWERGGRRCTTSNLYSD
jgi:hypothetical protein